MTFRQFRQSVDETGVELATEIPAAHSQHPFSLREEAPLALVSLTSRKRSGSLDGSRRESSSAASATDRAMPHTYAKTKRLGSGTFGTVYLATNEQTGEACVLKEIKLKGLDSKELAASLAETDVLRGLRHPNIVAYRDSFSAGGTLAIVMELAEGGDLGRVIQRHADAGRYLPEAAVLKIAAQAADALAYCHHEKRLLHRDLKPENIFLTRSGDVKIGDFGISKVLSTTTALAQTKCGTGPTQRLEPWTAALLHHVLHSAH